MKKIYEIEKDNYEDAGQASRDIKKILKQLGMDSKTLRRISIACYEAEINIVIHSLGGTITFVVEEDGSVTLFFDDVGPGISDIPLAMTKGYSTASDEARKLGFGAGMGLDNMKNCANEFDIRSSKEGTHIRMRFE